jgi:hypothetical protein
MAATVACTTRISWSSEGSQIIFSGVTSDTQSGEQAFQSVQIIGATSEAVTFGDVTSPGWLGFKNLNADGGSNIGISTTNPAVIATAETVLRPGDSVVFKSPGASNWYAISSSGNSNLLVCAIEP